MTNQTVNGCKSNSKVLQTVYNRYHRHYGMLEARAMCIYCVNKIVFKNVDAYKIKNAYISQTCEIDLYEIESLLHDYYNK